MGFFDYVTDIYSSLTIQTADAERADSQDGAGEQPSSRNVGVKGGASADSPANQSGEQSDEEAEVNAADAKKQDNKGSAKGDDDAEDEEEGGDDAGEEEEEAEEEEEDEEEPEDIKPKLEEECMKSRECAPLKHHYDECAERVTKQQEDHGKADEDCVEEFFHLMHCATQCAAPKLFRELK